jgi:hypothetical protein
MDHPVQTLGNLLNCKNFCVPIFPSLTTQVPSFLHFSPSKADFQQLFSSAHQGMSHLHFLSREMTQSPAPPARRPCDSAPPQPWPEFIGSRHQSQA